VAGSADRAESRSTVDLKPSARDAALIERMEAGRRRLVGALNMGEYAYDFTGENVHDGPSRNPHDVPRIPAGSSGAPAPRSAGGLVPLALGWIPTARSGAVVVLRNLRTEATYGRRSVRGRFPSSRASDHLRAVRAHVRDLALAMTRCRAGCRRCGVHDRPPNR